MTEKKEKKENVKKTTKKAEKKKENNESKIIAVVRIRGIRNIKPKIRKTLDLLKLNKPNHAVLYKESESIKGMLSTAKDYITFGYVNEETIKKLIMKRGEKGSKRTKEIYEEKEVDAIVKEITDKGKTDKVDPVFRLHPPRRGWKNIKMHYPRGDLGKRDNMDEIIRRMM